jgi:hypothetical protein
MREVYISDTVHAKIHELELYLKNELNLSKEAALKRSNQMRKFVFSLNSPVKHALCRFKQWRILGYHCAIFEKTWIFAYEIFEEGIIIRDMSHTAILKE